MPHSVKPATAVRPTRVMVDARRGVSFPQIDLEEVTRRRLHQSPLVSANQMGLYVNCHDIVAYVLHSVADREPAAKPHLVTVLASADKPATVGLVG